MNTELVASLPIRSTADLQQIGNLSAERVELRLDYLDDLSSFSLNAIEGMQDRLILTVRQVDEGGVNDFGDSVKKGFIVNAIRKGFLVDVEAAFAEKYSMDCRKQIVSKHYLKENPDFPELEEMAERYNTKAAIFKIALTSDHASRINLIRLLSRYDHLAVMEVDGEQSSRLLYSILGSRLLYCHTGEKTSQGQISCTEAEAILRIIRKD